MKKTRTIAPLNKIMININSWIESEKIKERDFKIVIWAVAQEYKNYPGDIKLLFHELTKEQ